MGKDGRLPGVRPVAWIAFVLGGCGRLGFGALSSDAADDPRIDASCGPGSDTAYTAPMPPADAFWVAPGGTDSASGRSRAEAWATFAHAFTIIGPGDTLVLADGTYSEQLNVSISGSPGSPITVRAESDGGAIIDGAGAASVPCLVSGPGAARITDVIVEGIQCKNSGLDVVRVVDGDRITLRRVSAFEPGPGEDLFNVTASTDVLVEDCAASGRGHIGYVSYNSQRTRFRRAWVHLLPDPVNAYHSTFALDGTSDSVIENCVGTMDPVADNSDSGIDINIPGGIGGDRNLITGNVVHDVGAWGIVINSSSRPINGNQLRDTVVLGGSGGVHHRADASLTAERLTLINNLQWRCWGTGPNPDPKDPGFALGAHIANSILVGCPSGIRVEATAIPTTVTAEYNDLFAVPVLYEGLATAGTGDVSIDPVFDVDRFGPGAYLRAPALGDAANGRPWGARVLYRSFDGVVSNEPIWPWPMEERIRRETGISVTWEEGGGLWRTLCGAYD